jgi:hypothetical protein
MAKYRVDAAISFEGCHVVSVRIEGSDWTIGQVISALERGDTFYTTGWRTGRVASVAAYRCHRHRAMTLCSGPDATFDNNLDNLIRL